MKIALIGYGKMGKAIEKLVSGDIVAKITSRSSWEGVEKADVCIDFSHPEAVMENMKKVAALNKPAVIGTTGWDLQELRSLVKREELGVIYAHNFSIGMHHFLSVVEKAAQELRAYDVAISEMHHKQKVDAPSGTAHLIAHACQRDVPISSLRVGTIPGTHSVIFDSQQDTITLTHQAHDRTAWALGAIEAAQWIQGKKGLFTLKEMLCQD